MTYTLVAKVKAEDVGLPGYPNSQFRSGFPMKMKDPSSIIIPNDQNPHFHHISLDCPSYVQKIEFYQPDNIGGSPRDYPKVKGIERVADELWLTMSLSWGVVIGTDGKLAATFSQREKENDLSVRHIAAAEQRRGKYALFGITTIEAGPIFMKFKDGEFVEVRCLEEDLPPQTGNTRLYFNAISAYYDNPNNNRIALLMSGTQGLKRHEVDPRVYESGIMYIVDQEGRIKNQIQIGKHIGRLANSDKGLFVAGPDHVEILNHSSYRKEDSIPMDNEATILDIAAAGEYLLVLTWERAEKQAHSEFIFRLYERESLL